MNETRRLIEEGKVHYENGRYAEALASFGRSLDLEPGNGEVFFEMGKTCYVSRDYRTAVEYLERAAALHGEGPGRRNISLLLAKTHVAAGDFGRAAQTIGALKERFPDDAEVLREWSDIRRRRYEGYLDASGTGGDYAALADGYRRRIEADPSDERALVGLTQICNFLGEYDKAAAAADAALAVVPAGEIFLRNKLLNERELAGGKTVLESKVRSLTVTLSNRCNISCTMCLTSKHPWELPAARIEELRGLFPYLEKIMWQGGEVFVLPYFRALLRDAASHPHLRQSVVTNGQLITAETAEELAAADVELTFSVDGATPGTYERIRRGARFDTLREAVRLASAARKRHGTRSPMNMNVAVMRSNYRELRQLAEFAGENSFDFLCLMPINTTADTPEDIFSRADAEALRVISDISPALDEIALKGGFRLENRLPRAAKEGKLKEERVGTGRAEQAPAPERRLCHLPWFSLLFDYDGTVRPDCLCPEIRSAGTLAGSTIAELWNGRGMQEWRAALRDGKGRAEFCGRGCVEGKISEEHLKFVKP